MRYIIYVVLTLLLFGFGARAYAADEKLIVIFGDSITAVNYPDIVQSYSDLLEKALQARGHSGFKVVNLSKPGARSSTGVERLPLALEQKPYITVVEFGTNDLSARVPARQYLHNLDVILSALKEQGSRIVLICAAPVKAFENRFYHMPIEEMTAQYGVPMRKGCEALARKYGAQLHPEVLGGIAGKRNLLLDEVHPNTKGMKLLVEKTVPLVERELLVGGK